MLTGKWPLQAAWVVGILCVGAAWVTAQERAPAEAATAEPAAGGRLIFYDGFEYEVKRDERNAKPAFITEGKWSVVKSQNQRGKGLGYLYTVERIPGYTGVFPGRNSKRVLAIEARSKTFKSQTDFYLQYGKAVLAQ